MEQYADVVLDLAGNAVEGATVQVLSGAGNAQNGYNTAAVIYDVNGVVQPNPIATGRRGEFAFMVANGKYVLRVTVRGTVYATVGPLTFYDPADDAERGNLNTLLAEAKAAAVIEALAAQSKRGDMLSVFDFLTPEQITAVKARTYQTDLSAIIQNADTQARAAGKILYFPAGGYLAASLELRAGSNWRGANAGTADWRVPAMGVTTIRTGGITTSQLDLNQGYVWGVRVSNLTIEGANVAVTRGLYLKRLAASVFEDVGLSKFARGVEIEYGMMNEFNRVNSSKCTEASFFLNGADITTSQTFNRCVGRESPWAWVMESTATGNSIGTVLNGYLVESTTLGGINVHKSCAVELNSLYGENAPDDRATTSGTFLRLYKDGVDVDPARSVAVLNGGDLAGGNFNLFTSSVGIDIGAAKYVSITGTEIQRATIGIRWDATTADGAIHLHDPVFVQVGTLYSGPAGKMSGSYPSANLTANPKTIINADQIGLPDTWTAGLSAGSGTITIGAKTGGYTRAGQLATVSGLFTVDAVASPAGVLRLTGLPFPCAGGFQSQVPAVVNVWYATGMTTQSVTAVIPYGQNYIEIHMYQDGAPADMASKIQAGTQFHVFATYPVA